MLKIAAYVSPLVAYDMPTGVGQHIVGMFSALQQRHDVALGILAPRGLERTAQALTKGHSASRVLRLPWPERPLRYATTLASLVNLDRWLPDVDWVYTPVEQPVTTGRHLAVTVHDLYPFETVIDGVPRKTRTGLGWRLRMRRILQRTDVIATVSTFTRSRMLDLFDLKAPERVVVVGNGGAEGFSPTAAPGDEEALRRHGVAESDYVLFPGSLTRRKGADLLLKLARLAKQRRMNMRFVVIGRRHDADLLQELASILEAHPQFPLTLLGYVDKHDLAALYRHARATLFPSRYEGFGIPVVEALSSGCPLFISSQPALMEVAAGRATVIGADLLAVLDALAAARRESGPVPVADHTWSNCAARLVAAMR